MYSGIGAKLFDHLPFFGSVDSGSVTYRQQLIEVSVGLVWQNPFFGNPYALHHMESLRQGQGIIDLVNVYLSVAIFSGIVGLFFFLIPVLLPTVYIISAIWSKVRLGRTPDLLHLSLFLAVLVSLINFAFTSFVDGVQYLYFLLIGLCISSVLFEEEGL
jgi:hypothetical protein